MKIYVINGPNLNMLGIREPDIYGRVLYSELVEQIEACAKEESLDVTVYQSNHEGDLVDKIQEAYFEGADGIVINPAAYTHTSIAILDALKAVSLPAVEVHISDVSEREDFRKLSFIRAYCIDSVIGLGVRGYLVAIKKLKDFIESKR